MSVTEARAGARQVVPMLLGIIPFGLVVGATPVAEGLGTGAGPLLSVLVFAGASQLAAVEVLGDGGSAIVAALTALTINLRMLLYSASLAPGFAAQPLRRRLGAAYLLVDQSYALTVVRNDPDTEEPAASARRLSFYLGAGATCWTFWQTSTVAGALVGAAVPDSVPLEFAVPLVFLVLLIPSLTRVPAWVAAITGGLVTVVAAELGAGPLSIMLGALAGIVAGAVVDSNESEGERAATGPAAES